MKCLYCIYKKRIDGKDGSLYVCTLIDEVIGWFRRMIGCRYYKSVVNHK